MTITEVAPITFAPAQTTTRTWHRVSSIATTLTTVLIVVVASVALVLAVATHFSAKNQYRAFGHPVLTVLSGSMSPVIRTGDLIVDTPLSPGAATHLHVGQIVSFRDSPGSNVIVTHRIVGVTHASGLVSYVTKGDANATSDPVARPASDVIGVFGFAVPRGGYVLNALHKPLVLSLLVASVLLWFVAAPLFRWARRMDESVDEERALERGRNGVSK